MDLKEAKRTLRIPQTVCDEFEERAVDMDVVLPDYCPEVTAVLKCIMRPVVTARFQSGDRYTVDGTTFIRVLYLTEDRSSVHSYEVSQPFSVSFRAGEALHHLVDVRSDYVNCRAIAPRRMDIHGAFRVFLKAIGEGNVTVFADPNKRDVFCQKQQTACTVPVCEAEKSFLIDEAIDLGVQAERLVYTDAVVSSCDSKVLTNKLIVKGTCAVKAVYCASGNISCVTQEIPFSQIVDINGLCDEWQCAVQIQIGETESHLQQNENGGSILFVNCKLTACVRCGKTENTEIVLDAYSVKYPLVCESMPLHLTVNGASRVNRVSLHQLTSLPEGVNEVFDIWGELKSVDVRQTDTSKQLTCCILVSLIARDDAGHLGYYERTVDCQTMYDLSNDEISAHLVGLSGSVNGSQLRVQADMDVVSQENHREMLTVVADVIEDEQRSYPKNNAAIRIVYATPGETVWDIAKHHHSCVEDILAENDLTEQHIHVPTMLMIPIA